MISEYLQQLAKVSLLSEDEEKQLWVDYKEKGDIKARQKLITSYQPLVYKLASQHTGDSHLIMDLVQEGTVGLIDAIDKYDFHRKTGFISFSVYYIKGRIVDYLRAGAGVRLVSLEEEKRGSYLLEILNLNQELPDYQVEKKFLLGQVIRVLNTLPVKEQDIIRKIYFEDEKADSVAAELEISLSYLYRLRKRAIKRLRGKLSLLIQQWS